MIKKETKPNNCEMAKLEDGFMKMKREWTKNKQDILEKLEVVEIKLE